MSKQSAQSMCLLARRGVATGRAFPLDRTTITVGRGQDNDVVVYDAEVSRRHARLSQQGDRWVLEDLGSSNGTFVNGQRITGPVLLKPGDQIGCGSGALFSLEAGIPASPSQTGAAFTTIPASYIQAGSKRTHRLRWLWAIVPLAAVIALIVLAGLLYLRRQYQARAEFEPPLVLVTQPTPGTRQQLGSSLLVLAVASNHVPIQKVELWLDGELTGTQDSAGPEGESPFYAYFSVTVPAGPHLLFARATDTHGMIGQSLPIDVIGERQAPPGQLFRMVRAEVGQTLADVAAAHQVQPNTLAQLNPGFEDQPLVPGSLIQVPASPAPPAPPQPPPPTSQPPSPAPQQASPSPSGEAGAPPLKVIPPSPLPIDLPLLIGFLVFKPPDAPGALQGEVKDCKVILRWNDNANNESHYEVWMAGPGLPPRAVLSLKPASSGPAWCEFPAPQPGAFSFWVQAVNLVGSAPSNIVSLIIDPKCPATLATYLQLKLLDLSAGGGQDRVYFYVSFEGLPEVRLPTDPSAFITMQGDQGNLSLASGSDKELAVPIPADGILNLSGECWGWAGNQLSKLGTFSGEFPKSDWDGSRKEIKGNSFQLGLSIQPAGATEVGDKQVAYSYEDPNLPVPHSLFEDTMRSISGYVDPYERNLSWKWDGDPKKIDAFKIYLNGAPYNLGWVESVYLTVDPTERSTILRLPALCGKHIQWQVSAVAGQAESKLSAPFEYDQPPCELFAEVQFNWVKVSFVDAGLPTLPIGGQHCDDIDTKFSIWANDKVKSYWGGTFFMPITCGEYSFEDMTYAYKMPPWNDPRTDTIVVPLQGEKPVLRAGATFVYDNFLDEPGHFGNHTPLGPISMTRDEWAKFQQTFEYWGSWAQGSLNCGVSAQFNVRVRGFTKSG